MITRRENLLIRPWEEKKYENHRKKVLSALPAIDNRTPPDRLHVAIKWKKQQKENERLRNIERDNFLLLQKLKHIMKTSRVDNWLPPQPNFLNRLGIYSDQQDGLKEEITCLEDASTNAEKTKSRKAKCPACTPQKVNEIKFPEERIPWEPMKTPIGRTARSKSVPPKKSPPLPTIKEKSQLSSANANFRKNHGRDSELMKNGNFDKDVSKMRRHKKHQFPSVEPQRIVLSRGCLKLSVNFPADTFVKFQDRNIEKCVMRGLCHCKSLPAGQVF